MERCAGLRVTLRACRPNPRLDALPPTPSRPSRRIHAPPCYTHAPLMRHFRATFAPSMRRRAASPAFRSRPRDPTPRPLRGARPARAPARRPAGVSIDSHGPMDPPNMRLMGSWLRLRCRRRRPPSRATWIGWLRTRAWPKKCRMNPKAAEILAYPRKGARKSGVAHGRHALSPPGDERGEASSRFDARSPRATRCISAGRPGSGCSRSWDSSPRSPMPAAA
jgi:hypothetical protein